MPHMPEFQQYQHAFTTRIRDPRTNPRPHGVPARRMKVYEELLFNNLESFLLACYPVLRKILGKRRWTALVRGFFAEHRCHSPLFRQIAEEFLHYLCEERPAQPGDLPFIQELAHYEWLELALSIADLEIDHATTDPDGDLLDAQPVINPVLARLVYNFPVHRISPRFKPQQPDFHPNLIAAFRDTSCSVRFVTLNQASFHLLEILEQTPCTGKEALKKIAFELGHTNPAEVIAGGLAILEKLREEGAILGTHRA